ncbi:unnamed protein product, partial [Effrenium voratum]
MGVQQRCEVLQVHCPDLDQEGQQYLAQATGGFLPCDLAALCRAASLTALAKGVEGPPSLDHFRPALARMTPTPMRAWSGAGGPRMAETGGGFKEVVGQHLAVETLRSYVVAPWRASQSGGSGLPPLGVLISGSPGSG